MNLRDIDIFHAIMISGGAGAAAALLSTSQPAISRSLAKLEAELGFSLFDRIRGRLVPTREALLFEPHRVCRRPQLLRGWGYDEQDDEQVLA